MKIKIEIDTEQNKHDDPPGSPLDALVIIGQGAFSKYYCPDPRNPGKICLRDPAGVIQDRSDNG